VGHVSIRLLLSLFYLRISRGLYHAPAAGFCKQKAEDDPAGPFSVMKENGYISGSGAIIIPRLRDGRLRRDRAAGNPGQKVAVAFPSTVAIEMVVESVRKGEFICGRK
jgi:hypothetical protein